MAIRRQWWTPDTHPDYSFLTEWDDSETEPEHVCVSATRRQMDGQGSVLSASAIEDFAEKYELVLLENQMKNRAESLIISLLPETMKKRMLDSDGDPILDENGQEIWTAKSKHMPFWFFGEADGIVEFRVPDASQDLIDTLTEALTEQFGSSVRALAAPLGAVRAELEEEFNQSLGG